MFPRAHLLLRRIPKQYTTTTRCYSTPSEPATPPLLLKIRTDLKTAMRAKDTPRLSVLRSILSATLNASKTSSPITTDMQVLSLIRKLTTTQKAAAEEFRNAGRTDLADKEEGQIAVLEGYASGVKVAGEEEVREIVRGVVKEMEGGRPMGEVLKKVFEGERFGKGVNVDKGLVARVVKQVVSEGK